MFARRSAATAQRVGASSALGAMLALLLLAGATAFAQQPPTTPDAPPATAPAESSAAAASDGSAEAAAPSTQPATSSEPPPPTTMPATAAGEGAPPANGKTPTTAPVLRLGEGATADAVEAEIQRVTAEADLAEDVKQRALALLNEALAELRQAERRRAARDEFDAAAKAAPERLAAAQALLDGIGAPPPLSLDGQETLAALEARLAEAEAKFETARKDSEQADERVRVRILRRLEIPREQADVAARLHAVTTSLSAAAAEGAPVVSEARRTALHAGRAALEAQAAALAAELRALDAVDEQLAVESELSRLRRLAHEAQVEGLREAAALKRKADAQAARDRAAADAALAAATAHPLVKHVADETLVLATRRQAVAAQLEDLERRRAALDARLPELEPRLREAQETVKNFGLTPAIGYLLRKQQRELDRPGALRRTLAVTERGIADAHFEGALLSDRRAALADLDAAVAEAMTSLSPPPSASEVALLESELRARLTAQREAMTELSRQLSSLVSAKGRFYTAQTKLLVVTERFSKFIDEHVLWVRSDPPLSLSDLPGAVQALGYFAGANAPQRMLQRLQTGLATYPVEFAGVVAAVLLAGIVRWRLRRALTRIGVSTAEGSSTSIVPTMHALLLTALCAAYWPMVVYIAAAWLGAAESTLVEKSVAAALYYTVWMLAIVEFFRLLFSRNGLGEAHFGWARDTTLRFRTDLVLVMSTAIPLVLVSRAIGEGGSDSDRASLGRLTFMAAVVVFAWLMHGLVRPRTGTLAVLFSLRPGGLFDRLRFLWYIAGMGSLAGLIALAAWGYLYSAGRIAWCVQATVWMMMILAVANALLLRWMVLAHRRLTLEQAARAAAAPPAADGAVAVPAEPEADLSQISHQTQRLVRSIGAFAMLGGLWMIWDNVLPALEMLRSVAVWGRTTLADLLLSLAAALLTLIAAKNIPGMIEMLVLRHLPFDQGVRYAYTTISRYLIVVFGVVTAFNFLGVEWGSVQWLVAAMTVGLGFGLQEIFANFVSGIIVLFERPIRIGDVVTVGDTTGVVTQIRTRATTIRDWERKELIVPNRELVTGRIVNWTLNDSVIRITIPLGVAYGSDTRRLRSVLLRVARENPRVLAEPEPSAVFLGFGDSTLNFELRVFVASPEDLVPARNLLNTAIDDTLREEGIEIAFPQRDVNVRVDAQAATALAAIATHQPVDPPPQQRGPAPTRTAPSTPGAAR